ncbi:hypothetical protein [Streptomyces anulatus]|uniref:hypothetical protein n=1 Tax=Streptomyces anulatus TaxID=1892 RepID=UPI00342A5587
MDPAVREAIEITPAAGTRERIFDITTTGRRTGHPRRIEFFRGAAGPTCLCGGASGRPASAITPTSWPARTSPST